MAFSAAAIVAVVGGALAFRTAGQTGTVYCFDNSVLSQIKTTEICTANDQPSSTLVGFVPQTGGTATPCGTTQTPFINNPDCSNASALAFSAVAP